MTKGQKLYNGLVAVLTMRYPHINEMTVRDARNNAYQNDHWVLHSILNRMIDVYPEYADKTFARLESRAIEMEYKELKKKVEKV